MPDSLDTLEVPSQTSASDPYASTIQTIEGWYPGSKSYRNNNPGNLRFADQPGASGADAQGFAQFPDYTTGLSALHKQIALDTKRGLSIQDFAKKYAPVQDGNNPDTYAAQLAKAAGKNPTDKLSDSLDALGGDSLDALQTTPTKPSDSGSVWDRIKGMGQSAADYIGQVNKNLIPSAESMFHNPFDPQPGVGGALQSGPNPDIPGQASRELQGFGQMLTHPLDAFRQNPAPMLAMGMGSLLPKVEAAPTRLIPGTPEFNTMLQSTVKPMVEALKPTNPLAFEESAQRSIPLLLDENPKIGDVIRKSKDLRDVEPTISSALDKLHQKMNDFVGPHELAGDRIDGNIIANEKVKAIPPKLKQTDPAGYQQLVDEADTYRRPLKPSEVQSYLETTNDQAAGLYDKLPGERNISVGASAAKGQVITEGNAFREQLYKALDPEHNGALVRALQLRRGSLIDFKNQLESANSDIMKSPTPSLGQKAASAYDTLKGILPTSDSTAGPAVNRAATALKNPKAIQEKVASAFDNWKGGRLPEIESPNILTHQWPNTAPFPHEPATPSEGTPTDGMPPPRYGAFPSMQGMPERSQFEWQRKLFGDEMPGIPGNSRTPRPKYPGKPPSVEVTGPRQLGAARQNTLPDWAPKLLGPGQ